MIRSGQRLRAALVAALLAISTACSAADLPAVKIKVGEKMADFHLPVAGESSHLSLYGLKGKKAVAVIFIATKCPYSNAFNGVMANLAKDYESQGVAVIGINSNKTEPAAEVAAHAQTHGLGFPVLKDEGNVLADRLGATVTPEVFLLDGDWTLRYHGALGNSASPTTKASEATDAEVRPALDAILAGGAVPRAETKAFGCTIKR
jgi:peroxiredoxin